MKDKHQKQNRSKRKLEHHRCKVGDNNSNSPPCGFLCPQTRSGSCLAVQADGRGGAARLEGGVQPNPSRRLASLAICPEAKSGPSAHARKNYQRSSKLRSMTRATASLSSHSARMRLSSRRSASLALASVLASTSLRWRLQPAHSTLSRRISS